MRDNQIGGLVSSLILLHFDIFIPPFAVSGIPVRLFVFPLLTSSSSRSCANRFVELTDLNTPSSQHSISNKLQLNKQIRLLANHSPTLANRSPSRLMDAVELATPVTCLTRDLSTTLMLQSRSPKRQQRIQDVEFGPSSSYLNTSIQLSEYSIDSQFAIPSALSPIDRVHFDQSASSDNLLMLQTPEMQHCEIKLIADQTPLSTPFTPCPRPRKPLTRSFSCMDALHPARASSGLSQHSSRLRKRFPAPLSAAPSACEPSYVPDEYAPLDDGDDLYCGSHRPEKRTRFVSPISGSIRTPGQSEQQVRPLFRRTKSAGYVRLSTVIDEPNAMECVEVGTSPSIRSTKTMVIPQHLNFRPTESGNTVELPSIPGTALLPSVIGESDSIRRITPETLFRLISDEYKSTVDEYKIIDVRFPFEYAGGHIAGAMNINSFEALTEMFFEPPRRSHGMVIVFHCEFSSHRAPLMAAHLRAQDRIMNVAHYPAVYYPEIYVLEGGYKSFWNRIPAHCVPEGAYVPMDHAEFRDQCKRESTLRKMSLLRSKSSSDVVAADGTRRVVGIKAASVPSVRPLSFGSRPRTAPQ